MTKNTDPRLQSVLYSFLSIRFQCLKVILQNNYTSKIISEYNTYDHLNQDFFSIERHFHELLSISGH